VDFSNIASVLALVTSAVTAYGVLQAARKTKSESRKSDAEAWGELNENARETIELIQHQYEMAMKRIERLEEDLAKERTARYKAEARITELERELMEARRQLAQP